MKYEYSPLGAEAALEDPGQLNSVSHAPQNLRRFRDTVKDRTLGGIFGSLVALAFFITLYHFCLPNQRIHLPNIVEGTDQTTGKPASWFGGDCGSSTSEARTRGCRFDGVLHSWLPPACTYEEDVEDEREFMNMSDWKYYRDPQRTSEIPVAEVLLGDTAIIYTNLRWHLVHCTFVWKRMHRALINGRNIDSYVANQNHTHHCSEMLLLEVEPRLEVTRIFRKFPTCG